MYGGEAAQSLYKKLVMRLRDKILFFSPITLFQCTGSLLVIEKNGQYAPRGVFMRLGVTVLLLLCDYFYYARLKCDYGILFATTDGFTAKQLVSFITNLIYQFVFLHFLYIVFMKTDKIASVLNQFNSAIKTLTNDTARPDYVFCFSAFSFIVIMTIMLYCSNRRTQKFLNIMCYVIIDAFVTSFSFQIIYFVKLLQRVSSETSKRIRAINMKSTNEDLFLLENSFEKFFKLQDELQALFGLSALVTIFDHGLYFVTDCSDMMAFFVHFYYSESDASATDNISVYSTWVGLDVCFVLWFIFTCATTEKQVLLHDQQNKMSNELIFFLINGISNIIYKGI